MTSPYLNMGQAAIYLCFVHPSTGALNLKATRAFIARHKLPTKKRGRAVLVHRDALEAALETR